MASRTASLIAGGLYLGPLMVALCTGCTQSSNSEAAHANAPTPDAAAASARRATCEHYIATLSGREQDAALMNNPEVQGLVGQVPDLVICGAVWRDSEDVCQKLMPMDRGPNMECRRTWSIFHELRAYPSGRSFVFDDIDRQECIFSDAGPTGCDAFLAAMRSGDVKNCEATGGAQSICRAYISLDTSLCHAEGKLKGPQLDAECRKRIENRRFLAQGLQQLADAGPLPEKEMAKAALGQADACESYRKSALQLCAGTP
jgi:hypothetical protein